MINVLIGFTTVVFLYVIFSSVHKLKKIIISSQMHDDKYFQILKKYENDNKSKVIFIVDNILNKQKIKKLDNHIVSINSSDKIQNILQNACNNNINIIDIVIQTNGGEICANDIIVNNLQSYKGTINIYVPRYSASAGSLIVLTGTNIFMNEFSYLTPTDPIVNVISHGSEEFSAESLIKLLNVKNDVSHKMLLEIYEYKKLYDHNVETLKSICKSKLLNSKITKNIIKLFGSGKYPHSVPFSKNMLISAGLPILDINNSRIVNIFNDILDVFKK